MYRIEYLPLARQDMIDIMRYISKNLHNLSAAEKLTEEMIEAAEKLAHFPYINAVVVPLKPLKYEYRKLLVQNYIMFYWVDEMKKTVTVARIIYARRDYEKVL